MITALEPKRSLSRAFQFRIGTLLLATSWAGLVSLGLRTPTPLWSAVATVFTLLAVLTVILIVVYRTQRMRAIALGFLVFCVGYMTHLAVFEGNLSSGLQSDSTPTGELFGALFARIHPPRQVSVTGGFGGGSGGFMGGGFSGTPTSILLPAYNPRDFIAICNYAFAWVLGFVGAILAQVLYGTQRRNSAEEQ